MPVRIYSGFSGRPGMGCVGWDHKGYIISISTIAQPPELIVFAAKDNNANAPTVFSCSPSADGVKKAVEYINRRVKRESK